MDSSADVLEGMRTDSTIQMDGPAAQLPRPPPCTN